MTDEEKRRPYGAGTIEPRRGRFRVRVAIDGKYRDLDTVDTLGEAESLLRGYAVLAAAGEVVTEGETLRDYSARWLDQRELAGNKNIGSDRSRWALHVLTAPFADQPIATLGRRDLKDWIARLRGKRASDKRAVRAIAPQTVKHVLTLIRSCLQSAVDDEILTVNPATKIKGPRISRDEGWSYLVPEEQARLLTCAQIPEPERMLIAFAISTGLREGEIWNLELADLVVMGPHPHVMVKYGKPNHGPPKNGKIRRVPLFGIALAAARRWAELLPTYCRKGSACSTCGKPLAFPTARGCRRADGKPPRHWQTYLRLAGLGDPSQRHDGRPFRFHDLRHTTGSSLVAGWWGRLWQLAEVRDLLGHTSVTVTERYAHLAPGVLAAAASATVAELPRATVVNLPQISPALPAPAARKASKTGRATEDSNLWPSAPEADALSSNSAQLPLRVGDRGDILVPLAERYLQAVASRNRFSHRYGIELAQATLAAFAAQLPIETRPARARLAAPQVATAQLELDFAALARVVGENLSTPSISSPARGETPIPPAAPAPRPGLRRARPAPPPELEEEQLVAGDGPRGRR